MYTCIYRVCSQPHRKKQQRFSGPGQQHYTLLSPWWIINTIQPAKTTPSLTMNCWFTPKYEWLRFILWWISHHASEWDKVYIISLKQRSHMQRTTNWFALQSFSMILVAHIRYCSQATLRFRTNWSVINYVLPQWNSETLVNVKPVGIGCTSTEKIWM